LLETTEVWIWKKDPYLRINYLISIIVYFLLYFRSIRLAFCAYVHRLFTPFNCHEHEI